MLTTDNILKVYDGTTGALLTDVEAAPVEEAEYISVTALPDGYALLQYNDVVDNWSTNLRLGWLQTANTGLFVVYNENRATDPDPLGLGVRDRSLTVKFSRLFDLLD